MQFALPVMRTLFFSILSSGILSYILLMVTAKWPNLKSCLIEIVAQDLNIFEHFWEDFGTDFIVWFFMVFRGFTVE